MTQQRRQLAIVKDTGPEVGECPDVAVRVCAELTHARNALTGVGQ
jgi:hypothetical protein